MASVNLELSFEQLLTAINQLPQPLKIQIYNALDAELHQEIERDFERALQEIWGAYQEVPEAQVNADIEAALEQVRAEHTARRP